MQLQQGDVLIKKVATIPEKARTKNTDVLEYGEVTGHAHRIKDVNAAILREWEGITYMEVLLKTQIVHEEHNPITIQPGLYRLGRVKEYDYEKQEERFIAD